MYVFEGKPDAIRGVGAHVDKIYLASWADFYTHRTLLRARTGGILSGHIEHSGIDGSISASESGDLFRTRISCRTCAIPYPAAKRYDIIHSRFLGSKLRVSARIVLPGAVKCWS